MALSFVVVTLKVPRLRVDLLHEGSALAGVHDLQIFVHKAGDPIFLLFDGLTNSSQLLLVDNSVFCFLIRVSI